MKKIIFISFLSICLLLIFIPNFITSLNVPENCDTCPPPGPECKIECNTKKEDLNTSYRQYFNYTIPAGKEYDVYLRIDPELPFGTNYDLYWNLTEGECTDEYAYDEVKNAPGLAPDVLTRLYTPAGTYHFMVLKVSGTGNYTLNLTCGHFCGNEEIDWWFGEECDFNATDPNDPCQSYQRCNTTCQCHDFREEMEECNYYDYCVNGTNITDNSKSCCEDENGDEAECCYNKITLQPVLDCSLDNAVRNTSVNVSYEYCHNVDYDITDVCIDGDYWNHSALTCSGVYCGDGVCQENEDPVNCPGDCA